MIDVAGLAAEPALADEELRQHVLELRPDRPAHEVGPARKVEGGLLARGLLADASRLGGGLQLEPEMPIGRQGQRVGRLADLGKLDVAQHLDRDQALEARQVQLGGLGEAGEIGHAEDLLAVEGTQVGQDLAVGRTQELDGPAAEDAK